MNSGEGNDRIHVFAYSAFAVEVPHFDLVGLKPKHLVSAKPVKCQSFHCQTFQQGRILGNIAMPPGKQQQLLLLNKFRVGFEGGGVSIHSVCYMYILSASCPK